MNKLITKSLIASMPRWVKCLTVDSNGKLWGHGLARQIWSATKFAIIALI